MDKLKTIIDKLLNQAKRKQQQEENKRLIMLLTIFFVLLVIVILVSTPILAYEYLYQDKIYAGVYVDGINIGGLTAPEAIDRLNQYIDNLNNRGLTFRYKESVNVPFNIVSPQDPDLSFTLVSFEIEKMVAEADNYGRTGSILNKVSQQLKAILHKKVIALNYKINETELTNILKSSFAKYDNPIKNAAINWRTDGSYQIMKEQSGSEIDYQQGIKDLGKELNLISLNTIELRTKASQPLISQKEAEGLRPQIDQLLALPKLILKYQDKKWEINKNEFKQWLVFARDGSQITLAFDPELIKAKLTAIGQEINIAPQDAKFVFTDNKVTEFAPALAGLELDQEQSLARLNQEFVKEHKTEIELIVKESDPKIKTADTNTLGIKELIGKGVSDFAGSHTNRIKNIKNAVNHLNGIVIPPGEFSTVDAIGEVNAETGYFQEFVIKGDRTIPEYGGGLCQIGTTMFRAALYSGLPITERRPHSYIVSYYKPLGMDSTIYGPHPDMRFMNDTGHNILLQIKIDGTQLTFEFWGTSDGRKVEITDPELYNWTAQPADKLIENPKLKPGDKVLKETGRRGADAHFYRYLTLASGEKKEEIFRSHYVPWPNIYEVGVTPKPETPAPGDASQPETSSSQSAGQTGSEAVNQNINAN